MKYLVGIGNYIRGDDSIGLRIAEYVSAQGLNEGFEVLDIADNGLNLLGYFEDAEEMLWIDAVRSGRKPGEFFFFSPDDVESEKKLSARTTHEGDFLQVLRLARQLGYRIPPIVIMGIEPAKMDEGIKLSLELSGRFGEYVEEAVRRLR